MPRFLTLLKMRFKSPIPPARLCISPSPRCTSSSLRLTRLKLSPSLRSKVEFNFSSTIMRICSKFFSVLSHILSNRLSSCSDKRSAADWFSIRAARARVACSLRRSRSPSYMRRSVASKCRTSSARSFSSTAPARLRYSIKITASCKIIINTSIITVKSITHLPFCNLNL